MTTRIGKYLNWLALLAAGASLCACSAHTASLRSQERLVKAGINPANEWQDETPPPPPAPAVPDFHPVSEDLAPVKTRMMNIVVRNSTLGDVLHVVAEASGLNLLIDREVALDQPLTLSIRNVSAADALKMIFSSVDCFYTINNNILRVESVGTRVFELGHPALVSSYNIDMGGDILGGAMITASGGGGGSSNLKGGITTGSKADSKAFDFWDSMEKSLENILGKRDAQGGAGKTADSGNQQNQPGRPGAGGAPDGQPQQSVTINRLTGTIMVTASRKNMEKMTKYIENVRRVLGRQVMIEARIIEVQLNEGLNFGIDWSFLDTLKGVGTLNAGFGALNLATTSFNEATAAAAGANKFQVGLSRSNFQTLLTALKTQGDVKTLSNPKINVMNGHASMLTVGRNTSFISKVSTTTTVAAGSVPLTTFTVETNSILSGLMIGIVPYISDSGEISLNITPITSDLVSLQEKPIGAAANGAIISIPTVDLREMTTTVKMRNDQMVVIGGLISKKKTNSEEKVPILGDIPFLGKLFTRINDAESRSELVLLLRPHVMNND